MEPSINASPQTNADLIIQRPLEHATSHPDPEWVRTQPQAQPIQVAYPAIQRGEHTVLTIVLPLYNEEPVIQLIHQRLTYAIAPMGIPYELLFIDDGSRDDTNRALADIAQQDPQVTAISLVRHVGKETALAAGLAYSRGQVVIIMDADLQDPPERIPDMLAAWREGADVVLMRRKPASRAPLLARLGRQSLDHLLNAIGDIGLPGQSVDFMLYSRRAIAALDLLVDRKRYMEPMFKWMRLRETIIDYERMPRAAGASTWSLLGFLGNAPGGSFSMSHMMLRVLMMLGLAGFVSACCAAMLGMVLGGMAFHASMPWLLWSGLLYFSAWLVKYMVHLCPPAKRPSYTVRERLRSRMTSH